MTKRTRAVSRSAVLGGLVVCVIVGMGWGIIRIASIGIRAEEQMQCMKFVYRSIVQYVEVTGEWPRGWSDLAANSSKGLAFQLPRDQDRVAAQVAVRFDVRLADVAKMTPDTFDAFRPRREPYYQYKGFYESMIDTATKALAREQKLQP